MTMFFVTQMNLLAMAVLYNALWLEYQPRGFSECLVFSLGYTTTVCVYLFRFGKKHFDLYAASLIVYTLLTAKHMGILS